MNTYFYKYFMCGMLLALPGIVFGAAGPEERIVQLRAQDGSVTTLPLDIVKMSRTMGSMTADLGLLDTIEREQLSVPLTSATMLDRLHDVFHSKSLSAFRTIHDQLVAAEENQDEKERIIVAARRMPEYKVLQATVKSLVDDQKNALLEVVDAFDIPVLADIAAQAYVSVAFSDDHLRAVAASKESCDAYTERYPFSRCSIADQIAERALAQLFAPCCAWQLLREFPVPDSTIVAFNPAGTQCATKSGDGIVTIYDCVTGKELHRFQHDYTGTLWSVVFNTAGTQIATGSGNGIVRVFDIVRETELQQFQGYGNATAIAFNSTDTQFAIGYISGTVEIFDCTTGAMLRRFQCDVGGSAAFNSAGTRLAIGCGRSAILLDCITGAELQRFECNDTIKAIVFNPADTQIAVGSYDGTARIFDIASGEQLQQFQHDNMVLTVAFNSAGTLLATGAYDKTARIFDIATGAELQRFQCNDDVDKLAFDSADTQLKVGCRFGVVKVYGIDPKLHRCIRTTPLLEAQVAIAILKGIIPCDDLLKKPYMHTLLPKRMIALLAKTLLQNQKWNENILTMQSILPDLSDSDVE